MVLFIMLFTVVIMFESMEESLNCDHSIQSYQTVFACGVEEILKCDH